MNHPLPTLPQEGSTLRGRYLLGRTLGKGGMGVVYDAKQTRLESRVAIKVLRPEILGEPNLVARFEREAQIIAKLSSRHIVRVLDIDTTDTGLPYLVMEFLDGWDLASELRSRGPFPLERAIDVIAQLCSGIEDAHRAGVVHRDLKPSNVFLVANDDFGSLPNSRTVKILDFGVSKLVGSGDMDMTATASTLGTPRYMSPEQIRSSKNVDARSDVWAIGTIFYELLTARTPFQGESATGVAAAIVTEEPYPLRLLRPEVPGWVEKLINDSLVKDPSRRIASASAFRATLDQGRSQAAPIPAVAPAPSPPQPPAPLPTPAPEVEPPTQWQPQHTPWQQQQPAAQVATQSSWAGVPSTTPRPSKGPLIAIFACVFVLLGGGLLVVLLLSAKSTPPSAEATSKAAQAATATSSPAALPPASTATAATMATTSSPSGSAAPSSTATEKATAVAATPPPPPHETQTHEAPPPPPPPSPKDCPASRKILVGGKLTCP